MEWRLARAYKIVATCEQHSETPTGHPQCADSIDPLCFIINHAQCGGSDKRIDFWTCNMKYLSLIHMRNYYKYYLPANYVIFVDYTTFNGGHVPRLKLFVCLQAFAGSCQKPREWRFVIDYVINHLARIHRCRNIISVCSDAVRVTIFYNTYLLYIPRFHISRHSIKRFMHCAIHKRRTQFRTVN